MNHNSSEALKMNLQLHAEEGPGDPVPQPIDEGSQAIDDGEELTNIFGPEPATGGEKQKEVPGTSQTPQEPAGSESAPKYEIDGVQFDATDIKRWKELEEVDGNKENWKSGLNRRGQELNEQESALKQRETNIVTNQSLLDQYKQFRAVVDANADARTYFEQLVKNPQNAMQPALDKIQAGIDDRFSALDVKDADIRLAKDFKDYDPEVCDKALAEFNPEVSYDVRRLKYYAWKGINLESEIQKRIASGNEGRGPALPPLASGTPQKQIQAYKSPDEAAEAALKYLELQ
ncbi:hypothetical protein LCGC14_1296540 [marine sediment metagenome]|uniref:Scaffolding protein n=1 Tax=marine sediment metagenome TaxID=412755 RepID=A0A0F9NTQ7_9ZZZZ